MKNLLFLALCVFGIASYSYAQKNKESEGPTSLKDLVIAYYNQDSLKKHFEYYAEKDKYITDKQKLFSQEMETMVGNYQAYVERNQKKAQQGLLSQDQLEKIGQKAMEMEEEITRFEKNIGSKLEEETIDELEKLDKILSKHSALFCDKKGIDILLIEAQGGQISFINSSLSVTAEYIKYLNKMVPVKKKRK